MLKYLTHTDFQEIFPDIKKGLLRNPETILQGDIFTIHFAAQNYRL